METVELKVKGMECTNCALTIKKFLEKNGTENTRVNYATGDVMFDVQETFAKGTLIKGIEKLGYEVQDEHDHDHGHHDHIKGGFLKTDAHRFFFCLPFAFFFFLHMIPGVHMHWFMNPYIQLALTIPVYIVGLIYFGKSAWHSVRNGTPNMNVLVTIGATAAFAYSLYGTLTGQPENFMFYETTVTILTLVFLGNYLEEASIETTQRELKKLVRSQKVMATMIAFDENHQEQHFPVESDHLRSGDLILIKTGEQVPADCKILSGDAEVSEALITGESVPVHKAGKDTLIGGSVVESGVVKAQVTASGKDTVLSGIIELVKKAQGEKPPMQQLADKISAIFIPLVLGLALLTLIGNWIYLKDFTPALMRCIAVLVIACPCAMGLATPAAIAVGMGRSAKNGVLFRNAKSLELFKDIKQAVFDKTGTLTTGKFAIAAYNAIGIDESTFKQIAFSIEKYSNHPLAKAIANQWKTPQERKWKNIEEIKGQGMRVKDAEGNQYMACSYKGVAHLTEDGTHNIYIVKNDTLLGWIDLIDEVRQEAKSVIQFLLSKGISPILLSGDQKEKCNAISKELNISQVFAEFTPEQKLQKIADLSAQAPTIMVGDGINDAPALAKATIGISLSEASQLAMQSAQVVLMNKGLKNLPLAIGLGKHTYITIKQNLFWAFAYNIVAIPVAALGFLTPTFGALVMGLSDVVLAINSGRLYWKKVV